LRKQKKGGLQVAKPDNRADNAAHLQKAINHTAGNMEEAHEYLNEHADEISPEERRNIEEKNENRKAAMQGMISEIQDEQQYQQQQE
jgi:small acid-soluble spore protein (thioredoxin-like protein)